MFFENEIQFLKFLYVCYTCVCVCVCASIVCFACFYFRNAVENHKLACYFWNATYVWVAGCVCVCVCAECVLRRYQELRKQISVVDSNLSGEERVADGENLSIKKKTWTTL